MMKFFVKDFCETVQARVVIFGEQVDNDEVGGILVYICPSFRPSVRPFFRISVTPFRQRFLHNLAS